MLKTHLKRVIVFAVLGAVVGAFLYRTTPKVYEGSSQVVIATQATPQTSAVAETVAGSILSTGVSQTVGTEAAILRGKGIFLLAAEELARDPAYGNLLNQESADQLYELYDVAVARDSAAAMIFVKAHNPDLAAALANKICDVYNAKRMSTAAASINHADEVLQAQKSEAERNLRIAEKLLRDFKQGNKMVDLSSKASQLAAYQSTLTQQLDTAAADLQVQQANLAAIRMKISDVPEMVTDQYNTQESPVVTKLEDYLATLETQRTEALRVFNEGSKRINDIDQVIASTKKRLIEAKKESWRQTSKTYSKDAVRKQFEDALATGQVMKATLQRRISALSSALTKVEGQIEKVPGQEMQLAELVRQVQLRDSKYRSITNALQDLEYKGSSGLQQANMLFPARSNPIPVAPDLPKLLTVCVMGGAIIGFLFSLTRESLRSTAQTSNELSGILGLPVSATVPQLQPRAAQAVFKSLPDPTFKPLESFKFMAFSMLFSKDDAPKRVLFTSVGGAVGCTTSATQYAIAAAKTGIKVVLLDADLRHTTLSSVFGLEGKSGLREVINCLLLGSSDTDVLVPTEHQSLSVVPAGATGGDGITDVPVGNIKAFLDHLQAQADLIVIDGPPCDVVSDSLRFAPYVDSVCLVCSARSTKYTNVVPAIDLLHRAGAEDVRLVMTGASPEQEAFSRRSLYVVH